MLNKDLQKIFDKYNKKSGGNWLAGNFIPPEEKEKYRIMFVGQKPSEHFKKRPQIKALGNYNATSIDKAFHCYLQKYNLGRVYATDMVKTEGEAKIEFEEFKKEWDSNFRECLKEEIECYNPKIIVCMGENAEKLFNENSKKLNVESSKIYCSPSRNVSFYHPSYVYRYNKFVKWDEQFEELKKLIKKQNHDKK